LRDEAAGVVDGHVEFDAFGEEGGDDGGEGAAAAVGVFGVEAFGGEFEEVVAVVEEVGDQIVGAGIEALDDDGAGAGAEDFFGGALGAGDGVEFVKVHVGEHGGFRAVGGDDGGEGEEFLAIRVDGGGVEQLGAALGVDDGVADVVVEGVFLNGGGDGGDDLGIAEHAGFEGR